MGIHTSRVKAYLLKSRIDLLEKKNIFCIMMRVKVNYIKDAHNNVKNYFDNDIPKKF